MSVLKGISSPGNFSLPVSIPNGGTGAGTVVGARQTFGVPFLPQIFCSRMWIPSGPRPGTTSSRADIRYEKRYLCKTGAAAVSSIQALHPAFSLGVTGEQVCGNISYFEAAIEITSPATYQSFYSKNFGTIIPVTDGMPYIASDALIGFTLPAAGTFYIRYAESTEFASQSVMVGTCGQATGDASIYSPSAVSQIAGTGALTTPTGGTSANYNTACFVGIPAAPMAAVGIIGDSIPSGTGDTSNLTTGALGFVERGLDSVNGNTVPSLNMSEGSWKYQYATIDTSPRIRAFWPFVTHLLIELGTNDVAAGTSLSTVQTYLTNMVTAARATMSPYGKPLKIAVSTLMPRTTSTDSWATAANQTPVAGFTIGGVRDQYNAWLVTQVGTLIDAVVDVNIYIEDQANPSKWLTNGAANYPTTDGVHPTSAFHILAATAVNNWAATIAP